MAWCAPPCSPIAAPTRWLGEVADEERRVGGGAGRPAKLLAAIERAPERSRRRTEAAASARAPALEQLASLYADGGDTARLDPGWSGCARRSRQCGHALLRGRVRLLQGDAGRPCARPAAIAADPPTPPLRSLGAAETDLAEREARAAFEPSLHFDAHDSTPTPTSGYGTGGGQPRRREPLRRGAVAHARVARGARRFGPGPLAGFAFLSPGAEG